MIKHKKVPHVDNPDNGYVYVLSNPSMPGIVKIGYSIYGGQGRADSLYKNDTGVPTPFRLIFEIYCHNPRHVEKTAHLKLTSSRINDSREFFRVDQDVAIKTVANLVLDRTGLVCGEWNEVVKFNPSDDYHEVDRDDCVFAVEELLADEPLIKELLQRARERFRSMCKNKIYDENVEIH